MFKNELKKKISGTYINKKCLIILVRIEVEFSNNY